MSLVTVVTLCCAFACQPTPQNTTRVTGRVLSESGQPIRGAAVAAVGPDWFDAQIAAQPQQRTGDDGRFTITTTQAKSSIAIVAEQHCTAMYSVVQPNVDLGEVVLRRGIAQRGKVRNVHGQPLDGALVATHEPLQMLHQWSRAWHGLQSSRARTDAKGNFTIVLPHDHGVALVAKARGHFNHEVRFVAVGEPLLFALEPSREVSGQLVSADGQGVPGIVLVKYSKHYRSDTATDAEGRFRITVEERGPISICGFRPGGVSRADVKVAPEHTDVRLQLPAARSVTIAVVDAATKQPVAGASVKVAWVDAEWIEHSPLAALDGSAVSTTDAEGRVVLRDVSVEDHHLGIALATASGYAPTVVRNLSSDPAQTNKPIELARGIAVGGRVQDEAGKPLAGARVCAYAAGNDLPMAFGAEQPFALVAAATDADGHYTLPPLAPGSWRIEATADGYTSKSAVRRLRADTATNSLELTLGNTYTLRGRLRGVTIGQSWRIRALPRDREADTLFGDARGPDLSTAADVQPDGSFVLTGLRGRRRLALSIPSAEQHFRILDVDLGHVRIDQDTEHEFTPAGRMPGQIRGRVRSTGATLPHPRLMVLLTSIDGNMAVRAAQTVTRDGDFALPAIAGDYAVRLIDAAYGLGLAERRMQLAAAATAEVNFDVALTELRLTLSGPPERLPHAYLAMQSDIATERPAGIADTQFDHLTPLLRIGNSSRELVLAVPAVPFVATLHTDAWPHEGSQLGQVEAEPKLDRVTKLELKLEQ